MDMRVGEAGLQKLRGSTAIYATRVKQVASRKLLCAAQGLSSVFWTHMSGAGERRITGGDICIHMVHVCTAEINNIVKQLHSIKKKKTLSLDQ